MSHFLYKLYSSRGVLLYVGITKNLKQRMSAHRSTQPWFHMVQSKKVFSLPSFGAAADAELLAITSERPKFNKGHGGGRPVVLTKPCTLTLSVSRETLDRLTAIAKHRRVSRSQVVRDMVIQRAS